MNFWFLVGVVLFIVCRPIISPVVIVLPVLIIHFDIFKLLSHIMYTY